MTKEKRKTVVLLVSLGVAVLLLLLLFPVLLFYLTTPEEPTMPNIHFADSSLSLDIYSDEDYMSLDRNIYYCTKDGYEVRTEIPESQYASQSPAVQLLITWIRAAERGDSAAYNACFSPEYIEKSGEKTAFTMQKIYNITITFHGRVNESSVSEGYADTYLYSLSYKIKDNNGSLRNDMGSDVSRDQYITVVADKKGNAYVHGIRMYFPK